MLGSLAIDRHGFDSTATRRALASNGRHIREAVRALANNPSRDTLASVTLDGENEAEEKDETDDEECNECIQKVAVCKHGIVNGEGEILEFPGADNTENGGDEGADEGVDESFDGKGEDEGNGYANEIAA